MNEQEAARVQQEAIRQAMRDRLAQYVAPVSPWPFPLTAEDRAYLKQTRIRVD